MSTLEEFKNKMEEERLYYKKHYIQGFFRDFYHFILWGFPRRVGDVIRETKWGFQRMFRGYDDTAYWGLDGYITDIALPVLKWMRKESSGYPVIKGFEEKTSEEQQVEWNRILDKMILAFQELHDEDYMEGNWDFKENPSAEKWDEHFKVVKEGLELFATHYRGLWD